MDRREYLRTIVGAASLFALTGCNETAENLANADTATPTATPEPDPSINWSEEWLQSTDYRLSVDVRMNGVDEVQFAKGTAGEGSFTSVSSGGQHTIAGPETEHGPIESGTTVVAKYPIEPEFEGGVAAIKFGFHMIGSQEQASYPLFLHGIQGSTDPEPEGGATVTRTYQQTVRNRQTELTIEVPQVYIDYYEGRYRTRSYGAYVADKYDDPYLDSVLNAFEDYGQRNDLSDREIIDQMAGWVQNLKYTDDRASTGFNEYPKYPVETLTDKGGDCEDTCILLASMLERFGYGSVLLAFRDANHMALGVAGEGDLPGTSYEYQGTQFYYLETTAAGWEIGQLPENVQGHSPEFMTINDHPILVFNYAVQVSEEGGASVEANMRNVGNAPAQNAQFRAEFQDQSNSNTESVVSDSVSIPPEGEDNITLSARPPDDKPQRVRASVLLDGQLHDWTASDYQEPAVPPSE